MRTTKVPKIKIPPQDLKAFGIETLKVDPYWNDLYGITTVELEEEEEEALILKEVPNEGAEALYDIVDDEKELTAVAAIFEELLDDLELVTQE